MLAPDTEIQEVLRLRDEEELTFQQIAEQMGFSKSTAQRRYLAGMQEFFEPQLPESEQVEVPLVDRLKEDRGQIDRFYPEVIVGDCIITSDWHIPLHDPKLINSMVDYATKNKISQLIINGDFFHADTFGSYLPYQPEASWDQEKYDANLIMRYLLSKFDHVWLSWGNHDFRITRKSQFKYSFKECMHWALDSLSEDEWERLTVTDLDYTLYYPEEIDYSYGLPYRVCHPSKNYSDVPLTTPRKLAVKHSCSVITGHSHHAALGYAPNGKDLVIESGGFFDKNRTEYIQESTAHHEWTQGYVSFKDGVPTLHSPGFGNT